MNYFGSKRKHLKKLICWKKAINDFNVFYNGYDLYQTYSDTEIQNSINNVINLF